MHIVRIIGVGVVVAVMSRPPEWATLHGGGSHHGKQELHRARSTKRLVGKIAMVKAGNGKHPQQIQAYGKADGNRTDANPEDCQAGQMQGDERYAAQPVDVLTVGIIGEGAGLVVEPAQQHGSPMPEAGSGAGRMR
jgi:hypothetical protein